MKENFIVFDRVTKEYTTGSRSFRALDEISFALGEGEFTVILGPSGAGKSTLLNILGGMDTATDGTVTVSGEDISKLKEKAMTAYRAERVGFIFQFYNLIANLTALENVKLVRDIVKEPIAPNEVLDMVGLTGQLHQFPAQLSGGEQQRVAIARAVAKNPALLLCDEPTGALDSETGIVVLELLYKMSREYNKTVIIVTHNAAIAGAADRVIRLKNGKIESNERNASPIPISEVVY